VTLDYEGIIHNLLKNSFPESELDLLVLSSKIENKLNICVPMLDALHWRCEKDIINTIEKEISNIY
jgi:hypothetical protein